MATRTEHLEGRAKLWVEILGWYGAAAIVGAYALVTYNVLSADGLGFQMLNLTGSVALIVLSWAKRATQSVALNVVWAAIAISALVKLAL